MSWTKNAELALDRVLSSTASKKIAVFDADGTLWHDDIGDGFFKWQIKNSLAPGLKGIADPWTHYKSQVKIDPPTGYGWLAQINSGLKEQELLDQSIPYFQEHFRSKVNPQMRNLIERLKSSNFEIWICTASIKWAVVPALLDFGLNPKNIIGTEVELDGQSRLTNKVVTPVPYRSGKKYWVEKKLSEEPLLVAGNSLGDLDMMSLASVSPLAVVYKPHLEAVKESEIALLEEAEKRNWPIQIFQ